MRIMKSIIFNTSPEREQKISAVNFWVNSGGAQLREKRKGRVCGAAKERTNWGQIGDA